MTDVPGFIVDPSGRVLRAGAPVFAGQWAPGGIPLTGRDEPRLRLRLLSALPLPSRVLRAPLFLAAPDGAHVADPSDVMVGWPQLAVARMVSAGRAAMMRNF